MPIIALVLTLSTGGQFEIRSEGAFTDIGACMTHLMWRAPQMDFTRGNVLMRCMPEKELDEMLRRHFGGRA